MRFERMLGQPWLTSAAIRLPLSTPSWTTVSFELAERLELKGHLRPALGVEPLAGLLRQLEEVQELGMGGAPGAPGDKAW